MKVEFPEIPSPCFVLEENLLRKNLELIQSVSKRAGVEIILAFKGFAMWSAFPIVREYISGATASSLHEAKLCFEEMKTEAHTYAPVYDMETFPEIIQLSSHITFNSLSQYERFYPMIQKSGKKISVALRVNPEFSEVETELYNPCAPGSRLGVIAEQIGDNLPEGIDGLHFHTLCESYSTDLEKTLMAVEEKFGKFLKQVKWLNMGGGHLMTRKGYNVEHLIELLKGLQTRYPNLHIIMEPGSAFAWETGFLKASVLDLVENKGIKTAMVNVSFAAHMPDCLEMPYQPRIRNSVFGPVSGKPTYRMGGNTCLSGDYYGYWSFEDELEIGDDLILEDMIHYTMVKTTFFNGVQHPSIGMIKSNGEFQLIRKFGYEDYKGKLS
ncbi:carboxynorspermidine decarboxylase [Mangrovibacterium diazotrophicum]|uniref:Carboxynorspermidine/carboxyspermidine decarboxylase n=1 Tax=Mangrovibacterium diazotrophicum TaxID=1261403 RepID=A0A419VYT1_9BACT|nr:carboxynorspermidine decarboxylase [Mangrovibacterium diazotrophicum]RKD88376.1 carboxynorspermidine decarboxylase [Mangrovibacterium diazotrophicum]